MSKIIGLDENSWFRLMFIKTKLLSSGVKPTHGDAIRELFQRQTVYNEEEFVEWMGKRYDVKDEELIPEKTEENENDKEAK